MFQKFKFLKLKRNKPIKPYSYYRKEKRNTLSPFIGLRLDIAAALMKQKEN